LNRPLAELTARKIPMKLWINIAMVSMMALTTPACMAGADITEDADENMVGELEENVGEAEQALCQWNEILHYNYTDGTGTYRWHVSYNFSTGKSYVDERRIGGGFYKQYNLTPGWTICPSAPENITLKSGLLTLSGPHNCLPNNNEEVHLEKQRLLVRQSPFITYECYE
jgi:hypothetical protein